MKIPSCCRFNRSGLGNLESYNLLKDQGIEIFLEIPFDKKLQKYYSEGNVIGVNETYKINFILVRKNISVRKETFFMKKLLF
jgi:MinD superfamily P-loop ATPase